MFPNISGSNQAYLANLNKTQTAMTNAQMAITSGFKVQQPSDAPGSVAEILDLQAHIGANKQTQTNLSSTAAELQTADSSLQSASQALNSAISLATQGASSTATADQRANLAQQVAGLMQQLVGISNTNVNGRYIFSGGQDTQAAYQLDPTQPNGVLQIASSPATRVVVDASGTSIAVSQSAQQIFDARNSDGSNAPGNVFAAVNSLLTALQSNDQNGITQAVQSLQTADQYLNGQLTFYGQAQNRVATATDLAQKFQTQQTAQLSQLRDADIPTEAIALNQAQVSEQAALSVESTLLQNKNLFNYVA